MEAPFGAKVPKKGRKVNDMKRLKKALALALALTVVMAFSGLSVFAAPTMSTYNATVTVNGVENGNTVKLYKLADAVIGDDNVITYDFVDGLPTEYDSVEEITANGVDVTDMANKMGAIFGGTTPYKTGTASGGTAGQGDGTATITDVGPGWYYAIVSGDQTTKFVYRNMLINTVPTASNGTWVKHDATANAKKSEETITKAVGGTPDHNATTDTTDEYKVGDKVPFEIKTNIPQYPADSKVATFKISDTPTGVSLLNTATDPIQITVAGDDSSPYNETTANVLTLTASETGMEISFAKAYILAHPGAAVTVNYKGTLTGTPDKDGKTANNTAKITFNPNPHEDGKSEPEDKTEVKTYGYVFDKVDNESKALGGATFTLYSDAECKNAVKDADGNTVTYTSTKVGNKAYVYFSGLAAGTYYAKETSAPAGFKTLANPVEFTLSSTNATADNPATTDVTETNYLVNTTSVVNTPGSSLPETGGIGTTIFYIVGAILVVGAGILLISRRRMASK